ncbi:MAG: M3 family oligoendopeptidase [Candidatus Paceibacterota bacterium]|jgi:oligoendopeptidase F
MKTTWNLDLLYKSILDPKIEQDIKALERAYGLFAKKYRNSKSYTTDEGELFKALTDYGYLFDSLRSSWALNYLGYRQDLNAHDHEAEAKSNLLLDRLTKADNSLLFFRLALENISPTLQKQFLKSKQLAPFKYYLKTVFRWSKHHLSEPEEKILSLKAQPSQSLWVAGNEKILGRNSITFGKKKLSIGQAINLVADLPGGERVLLHREIMARLKDLSSFAEAELNAIVIDKKINDELRHFKKPYSGTLLSYENEEKTVESLVAAVNDHASISHRFYRLKAKLLKAKKLTYADRNVSIGHINHKFAFADGVDLIKKSFGAADPEFARIFSDYLEAGQIDVFPKVGKTGGAYCSSNQIGPTFVLLNHVDTADSVMTLAHEMGHAIHGEYSRKNQPPLYRDYTIASAEVASTFFENLAFEEIFSRLTEAEKVIALHDRINDDIQTIWRQIACFNFELALHNQIRAKGALTKEEIAALMNSEMKKYLGSAVELTEDDGYFFVYWSHIRRFFYVYSYAFGQLVSKALYERYRADKGYLAKIKQFLSAGGSQSPEDIFRSIGIDVSDPAFFVEGLRSVSKNIDRLESLLKKR